MKTVIIEQRIVKTVSCGRERKFGPQGLHPNEEKAKCHLGLLELHEGICSSCVWFEQNKVGVDGRALVTDRIIDEAEVEKLKVEYQEQNRKKLAIPLFDPQSPFSITHRED